MQSLSVSVVCRNSSLTDQALFAPETSYAETDRDG